MEITTELYRFGVALAIGALVGLERQSRLETPPEELEGEEPEPEAEPDAEADPETAIRAAVAAGESSRFSAAALREALRSEPIPEPTPAADASEPEPEPTPNGPWVPDVFQAMGLRTFILFSLCGALAGSLSREAPWVFAASFVVIGVLLALSYSHGARRGGELGLTSEVSAVIVFILGGMCAKGHVGLAGAASIVVTMTLSQKQLLHRLASKLRREDIQAVLKFAVLTFIILPLLPEEPVAVGHWLPENGPEAWWRELTISPRKIWYMVILISGISFAGYVLGKVLGTGRGLILTGVVGGMVSSTAVSLSYSQKSQESPEHSRELAIGVLLANAIMPVRLLVVAGVIAPPLIGRLVVPLLAMSAVAGLTSLVLYLKERAEAQAHEEVPLKNPFELGPAIKFGLLFGVVLFAAECAQHLFGDAGLYGVAILTGLTDVDAIGLAVADMVSAGTQPVVTGAITVALAAVTNTLVKGGFVVTMGSRQLRRITVLSFGLMLLAAAGGIAAIAYWA